MPLGLPAMDLARPHFIGIGGIGMSGLAKICAARGSRVSGSDTSDSPLVDALRRSGIEVFVGHDAANVRDATCVIVSQAIRAGNPELVAAAAQGIPVFHRAACLAALMQGHRAVVVAGTHGKSSTTMMLAVAFETLGLDPSYSIGADRTEPGSNAHEGSGDIFVAEADESDRSFHYFRPSVAIVLNVEEDHHDNYASLEEHYEAYATFAQGIEAGGVLVLCADNAGSRTLHDRVAALRPDLRVVTYGESDGADVRIVRFDLDRFAGSALVRVPDGTEVTVSLSVPGRHMLSNAVAALAAGLALGIDAREMSAALAAYKGILRRFTLIGEAGGVAVADSYAHHPTEIIADLETARRMATSDGRVVVVFQPHLYSRTQALGTDIGKALALADVAIVMDIYGSREDPIPGVTNDIIVRSARENGATVQVVDDRDAVPEAVAEIVRPNDLVLTMGAGDVTHLGPAILEKLTQRSVGITA